MNRYAGGTVTVRNLVLAAAVAAAGVAPAAAQDVASAGSLGPEQMRLRFQIAAMEGVWNTERGAPLLLFAWPDAAEPPDRPGREPRQAG